MNIIGPESLQQPQPGKPTSRTTTDKSARFGNSLQNAVDRSASSTDPQETTPLSEPVPVRGFIQILPQASDLADRASLAMDLLETYSTALSDPEKSLKEVEPALSAFVDETESVYSEYLQSGNSDAGLKEIMDALIKTSRSEAIRFQRGDYLDS